jgi:hypothetical protein
MSGLRAAVERLKQAVASSTERIEIIDTSGLAAWTPDNWPPWRCPDKHPIPPGWGEAPAPEPSPYENEEGTP